MNKQLLDAEVQALAEDWGLSHIIPKKVHEAPVVHGVKVVLATRRVQGGLIHHYVKVISTLSVLEAEIEAKRMAREEGLIVWGVIESSKV